MSQNPEHILVCLSSAPSNANIIRTAGKMRDAFGGSLTALYVQTVGSGQLSRENQLRLQKHLRLAEALGAEISTVVGENVAYQIAEFARLSKVTKVVLGRSGMGKRGLFHRKPLTEQLIALAPELDIYIIPDTQGENRSQRNPVRERRALPDLHQWAMTLGLLAGATLISDLFARLGFTDANIVTVYILCALLTALFTRSNLCCVVSSLVSVLGFNFFFTEPRLSFQAYETGYPMTFVIMLLGSLITGTLANRLAENAKESAEAAYRTKVLLQTNQLLQKGSTDEALLEITAGQLQKLLGRPLIVYPAQNQQLGEGTVYIPEGMEQTPLPAEPEVARWVLCNRKRAGATTGQFPEAALMYLAIRSGAEAFGVVGIFVEERPLEPLENSVMLSILGECALAMENSRNAREKEAAAVLAKNEQLRSDLLRAISHDLRTPLTSISGNAENLLVNGGCLDEQNRRAILSDIYDDSIWLIQLVENLLAITRIGDGRAALNKSAQLVDEVITESLQHIRRQRTGHTIVTQLPEELLLARMDARLISQVLVNLVENAIKYTPEGSQIQITARRQEDMIAISVSDNGPGIPKEQQDKVFDLFYTGKTQVADCRQSLGLGLALCRSIVTAHGGQLILTDNLPSGCIFTFTLPASEVTLYE